MTNKIKLTIPFLALGLMLSSTVFAANYGTTGTSTNTITTINTKKACIATAKTTRIASVKAANDIAKSDRANAKTTRDTTIAAAKTNTDKTAGAMAIKTANAVYKTSLKNITKTLATSIKTAWSNYATAIKACPKK